jgi:hypothetical protein
MATFSSPPGALLQNTSGNFKTHKCGCVMKAEVYKKYFKGGKYHKDTEVEQTAWRLYSPCPQHLKKK